MSAKPAPAALRTAHEHLWQRVATLNAHFGAFTGLYANKRHVEVVRHTADNFFGLIQPIFGNDIALSIARLLDPAETKSARNVTLETLIKAVPPGDYRLRRQLIGRLYRIRKNAKPIRMLRNKRIAHEDLETAYGARKLPALTLRGARKVIRMINSFMNRVSSHYFDSHTWFDISDRTVYPLISSLEVAERFKASRRK